LSPGEVRPSRAGGGVGVRGRGGAVPGVVAASGRAALARRKASPPRVPPPAREASRARWAASDSTLRTASSSDNRSRVISDSESGGCTLRSC
jgi:hypothetical protein